MINRSYRNIIRRYSFPDIGHLIISLFLLLLILPGKSYPQTIHQSPFSTFNLQLSGAFNINTNTFHQFWDPETGGELIIEMPFYFGDIHAGLHVFPYSGKSEYQPDFLSMYIFVGWGPKITLLKDIYWYNHVRVGSFQMYFDDSDIHESQALESELGFGAFTEFEYQFYTNWLVHTSLGYIYVVTNKPLELVMVTVGFSYTFTSLEWLRKFMQ